MAVELAARRFGLRVRTVPLRPTGDAFLDELGRALGPRSRLVAMSHVTTDSGTCLPAERICALAHERGALVLFDGAQAVGQLPLDLEALGCDFYAAMGYKWALGPMGSGFLYVRRAHLERLHPIVGAGGLRWQELAEGRPLGPGTAERFEFASRPWPEFFAFGRALEFLERVGVARIRSHAGRLAADARRRLGEIPGVAVHTPAPPEPSTGILAFSLEGVAPADLSGALLERWRIVQRAAHMVGRAGGVRVSFAVYTAPREVDRLVEAVRTLAREVRP
jgi:selenocysteine lyase/cysteine desulfurase